MPKASCPACGAVHTGATPLEPGSRPRPGYFSLCIKCGELSRFTEDLHLRAVDLEEMLQIPLPEREELLGLEERAKAYLRQRAAEKGGG